MNEDRTTSSVPPSGDEHPPADAATREVVTEASASPRGGKLRLIALGIMTLLGSSVLCMGMLTSSAAWYTSRSQFCNSCHIMEPYYTSWQHSSHSEVACIKCHFAPGMGEKVRGKMLGLVQLCTYITRSEGPRPVAEVADASCLRSGCHETRLLPGPLEFHGIVFDHAPHLGTILLNSDSRMARPDENGFREVSASGDAEEDGSGHPMTLRCTSCHGQADPSVHIAVSLSTCFLCHFKEGHFNEGVGACTQCHQIPDGHYELGGGMTFTHEMVYQNGVDCQNCHGGLNHGNGEVALVRCQVCHNLKEDLAKISDTNLMHEVHVTEHKVECLDCHTEITHSLDVHKLSDAASNCASCHPDHHREQVNLLMGTGALSVSEQQASMTATGVQCLACHREREVTATGTVVWRASAEVCISCHTDTAKEELDAYQRDVTESLADIRSALDRAESALAVAALGAQELADLRALLARLVHDLEFLQVGNGIHNIHYATTLSRTLFDETQKLCETLNVDGPTLTLPQDKYQFD